MRGKIPVAVCGAAGRMGREVVKAVSREKDMVVAAAVDRNQIGSDAGVLAGIGPLQVPIVSSLKEAPSSGKPEVMVDFTTYNPGLPFIRSSLQTKIACVIGTTGFSESDIQTLRKLSKTCQTPVLLAPNFALGAVLLMKFAQEAARYFSWSEIIELHHEKKQDAPSGTALRTAQRMLESRSSFNKTDSDEKLEKVRGGQYRGIRIHSVRLPGLVAHQEVLFGSTGEILTLRHDSISRESFMPGVILAIRKILTAKGLILGLEHLL